MLRVPYEQMNSVASVQDGSFRRWLLENGAIFPKLVFSHGPLGGMEANDGNKLTAKPLASVLNALSDFIFGAFSDRHRPQGNLS